MLRLLLCLISLACFAHSVLNQETAALLYEKDMSVLSINDDFARLNPTCIAIGEKGAFITSAEADRFHIPLLLINPSGCFAIFSEERWSNGCVERYGSIFYATPDNLESYTYEENLKFCPSLISPADSSALPLRAIVAASLLTIKDPSVIKTLENFAQLNSKYLSIDAMGCLLQVAQQEKLRIPILIVNSSGAFAIFKTHFGYYQSHPCSNCEKEFCTTAWNVGVCPYCNTWIYSQ